MVSEACNDSGERSQATLRWRPRESKQKVPDSRETARRLSCNRLRKVFAAADKVDLDERGKRNNISCRYWTYFKNQQLTTRPEPNGWGTSLGGERRGLFSPDQTTLPVK